MARNSYCIAMALLLTCCMPGLDVAQSLSPGPKSELRKTLRQSRRAQTKSDSLYAITLKSGSVLRGKIVKKSRAEVILRTEDGLEIKVPVDSIASIKLIRGQVVGGEFRRFDPNYSRLMFAPTGRPLRRADGYFSDFYVFFPSVAYGVTSNFSIMAGFSILPGVNLDEQLKYFAPRLGVQTAENFAISVGALYAGAKDVRAGIAFAVASFGPPDNSFTAGLGLGYTKEEGRDFEFAEHPVIMLGGNFRLSNNLALVSENWFITGREFDLNETPFGVALRFFGDRLAADVGMLLIGEVLQEGFPIPWLSFVYNFGR